LSNRVDIVRHPLRENLAAIIDLDDQRGVGDAARLPQSTVDLDHGVPYVVESMEESRARLLGDKYDRAIFEGRPLLQAGEQVLAPDATFDYERDETAPG